MALLRCGVKTCYYNKKEECCLENISVSGDEASESRATACESFKDKSEMESVTSGCCDEKTTQPVVSIDCEATKCVYNQDCRCNADKITIDGSRAKESDDTECASFKCNCGCQS